MKRKKTLEDCQEVAAKNNGKCLSTKYTQIFEKMLWECKKGHQWFSNFNNILNHNSWCRICSTKDDKFYNKQMRQCNLFAENKNGKLLSTEYVNAKTDLLWECEKNHQFKKSLKNIRNGLWCNECNGRRDRTIEFCRQIAKEKDGFCLSENYLYNKPMIWQCKYGHTWSTRFSNIYDKNHWCHACNGGLLKAQDKYIEQAKLKHNNKYDYSFLIYKNDCSKVKIICPHHGEFYQQAGSHLSGVGCPKCTHYVSKLEIIWLDHLNVKLEYRHKTFRINGRIFHLDAYDPVTNTIYEFYGDYWHGNPNVYNQNDMNTSMKKTFGTLYTKTMEREQNLREAGYNIISIWENDFNKLTNGK